MLILSDCRHRLAGFVPPGSTWTTRKASGLDQPERAIWHALSENPTAWISQATDQDREEFWRRLIVIGEAPRSQYDALHDALENGLSLDGPTAAMALDGHSFRGQRGRGWATLPGNLFLTVVLPVNAPADDLVCGLIMLPAVAVVDAIRACGIVEAGPRIKWVNDILIGECKVGGVLTGTFCKNGLIESAVLGIGVNVTRAPSLEPTPFVPQAGCLAQAGTEVGLAGFTWRLLSSVATWCRVLFDSGPDRLLRAYREASCVVDRPVRVWHESVDTVGEPGTGQEPIAAGVVRSIESDLSLTIEGREAPIVRGRLAFEEVCAAMLP